MLYACTMLQSMRGPSWHMCVLFVQLGCIRVAYHSVRCCVTYVCVLEWYVSQLYESRIFRASLGRVRSNQWQSMLNLISV